VNVWACMPSCLCRPLCVCVSVCVCGWVGVGVVVDVRSDVPCAYLSLHCAQEGDWEEALSNYTTTQQQAWCPTPGAPHSVRACASTHAHTRTHTHTHTHTGMQTCLRAFTHAYKRAKEGCRFHLHCAPHRTSQSKACTEPLLCIHQHGRPCPSRLQTHAQRA